MLRHLGRYALTILYCLYIYFGYHLLVLGAFADLSFFALLIAPVAIGLFWLIPREQRKAAIVFTLLFVFYDQAIQRVRWMDLQWFIINSLIIGAAMYPVVRWYAKLKFIPVLLAFAIAFSLNAALPDRMAQGLSHLWPLAVTEPLYEGELNDPFPYTLADADGDGRDEIVTIGNTDIEPQEVQIGDRTFEIENDQFTLFVYRWDGGLERIPAEQLDAQRITALLPQEYVGFPYYHLTDSLRLVPLVERQTLAETMTQFGTSPYRTLLINTGNIQQLLAESGGVYDSVAETGRFTDVELGSGTLHGMFDGQAFSVASDATQIVGSIQLGGGREGLIVKGMHLHLYEMIDGTMTETHALTRDMQQNLSQSEIVITDLNGNGIEEMTIAYPYPIILEPQDNGQWDILWGTKERSFRIESIVERDGVDTLLAMSKSLVRASDTHYLTGFSYGDNSLHREWKVYMPGVIRAVTGDLDGDGTDEIVTSRFGTHKLYVWRKHHIPVEEILIGLTIALAAGLAVRRWRWQHAK